MCVDHVLVDGELEFHLLPEAVDGRRVHYAARHLLVKVLVHCVVEVGRVTLWVIWVLNLNIPGRARVFFAHSDQKLERSE